MKKFNEWNEVKKQIDRREKTINFKEREIYWARVGENIGFEQNGKGKEFSRPVLVLKKFTKNIFFGIPLSTTIREGSFFYTFDFIDDTPSSVLLIQAKMFDAKRLNKKLGMMSICDFEVLKLKFKELLCL
jgi:mRNA interferase MazF